MRTLTTMRLAVMTIGVITFTTVLSVALLLGAERTAPDGLIAVAAGGVGALATLLTGSSSADREEMQIQGAVRSQQTLVSQVAPEDTVAALIATNPPPTNGDSPA